MACPYISLNRRRPSDLLRLSTDEQEAADSSQRGYNAIENAEQLNYANYLKLPQILSAQKLCSADDGKLTPIHDEHLFIITHQTFELWFKQILYEVDSICSIFASDYLEERNTLVVIQRLDRISQILKHLCGQFLLLETMTPQDFLEMRPFLEKASGFQSLQFRLMEIKLGVREELRVLYNKNHYSEVFFGEDKKAIEKAKSDKSLFDVVNDWLERTPGLKLNGFNFFDKFKSSVCGMLEQNKAHAETCEEPEIREALLQEHKRKVDTFESLFQEDIHQDMVTRGDRRFSHKAMQGALFISLYCEEPRIHLPFQLLQCLMDIDNHFTKLRYSHTCLVQRMIGRRAGTGGSSGYMYLRSTCSDRYKVFLDLMNISTFLITRDRIPPLSTQIKKSLHDWVADIDITKQVDVDSGVHSNGACMHHIGGSVTATEHAIHTYRILGKTESTV